ncbi:hypothetical protein ElyMa_003581100 [Elysia marginata]|uniref:Uncharacterized protein n=1 Tax=Elysia marginata TaxID=1093978 RepID=A0AAV4EN10_9GAST|nr:hypothetical protein ElyMa_003581100 [Elysia marginata]
MVRLFYNSTGVHMQNGHSNSLDEETGGDSEQGSPERALGRGLLNLETAVTVEDDPQLGASAAAAAPQTRSLVSRVKAILFGGSGEGDGKEKSSPTNKKGYERFSSQVDLSRNLGLFAGVFAPVALGQFANNLFLRTGKWCDNIESVW